MFVARHLDILQPAFCQRKQVFWHWNWNRAAQINRKIGLLGKIDLACTRQFSSKCCKQVELLLIIPRLSYIFDGKKKSWFTGGGVRFKMISCLAFMSDNLSCSHMISIKALNTVKPLIFNGLAAMSHLLQRAGQAELTSPTLAFELLSHSDQVWRWPFEGIISARLSWV